MVNYCERQQGYKVLSNRGNRIGNRITAVQATEKDLEDWLNSGSKDFGKYELYEVKPLTVKVEVTEEGPK